MVHSNHRVNRCLTYSYIVNMGLSEMYNYVFYDAIVVAVTYTSQHLWVCMKPYKSKYLMKKGS